MRILMISDVYFPRINGVSTSILTFQQEFSKLGHEVHIVAPMYPAGHAEMEHVTRIESRCVMLDPEIGVPVASQELFSTIGYTCQC